MIRGFTTRRLDVFGLHIRTGSTPVDYRALFTGLAAMDDEDRKLDIGERTVAIPVLKIRGNLARLVAYEGERGRRPLFYNEESGRERIEKLRPGEILATRTHGLIDLVSREAIIEYNHRGAKARDIADTLEELGQPLTPNELTLELNPMVTETFQDELKRFKRIRVASVKISRPNFNWDRTYGNLMQGARESNAQNVELSMSADRGESLSKAKGLIGFLRRLAQPEVLSIFKNAHVTGTREGEEEETTIALANYVENQRVTVRLQYGQADAAEVDQKIEQYMESRRRRN
jgi:hypothetical protein